MLFIITDGEKRAVCCLWLFGLERIRGEREREMERSLLFDLHTHISLMLSLIST